MICRICGSEFIGVHKLQLCGDVCRKEARRLTCNKYARSERGRAKSKVWMKKNKSRHAKKSSEWVKTNRAKTNGYKKKWKKNNPWSSSYYSHIRRARAQENIEAPEELKCWPEAERGYIKDMLKAWGDEIFHTCAYCDMVFAGVYHIDHAIPICQGGPNCTWNLRLSCPPCNLKKHGKTPWEMGWWPKKEFKSV